MTNDNIFDHTFGQSINSHTISTYQIWMNKLVMCFRVVLPWLKLMFLTKIDLSWEGNFEILGQVEDTKNWLFKELKESTSFS
jgi:hypothetical protein